MVSWLFVVLATVLAIVLVIVLIVLLVWLVAGGRQSAHRRDDHPALQPDTGDQPHAPPRCAICGNELPPGALQGQCPRCLLKVAIEGTAVPMPSSPPTAAYSPGFTPATPEELAAAFPQLEILELLGKGGMGAVYRARQPHLDRLVALKVLPPDSARDPAFAERFAREARALARLNHPHIVTVHDFGESGGLFYLLMEYVDGVNLRQAMRAGQLTPEEALRIVPQLCEALQFAHDEGVVHRDIKPENILLDKRGRVKVADFGLAKLLGQSAADSGLTGTHQVMGTMHYMAPEQLAGARAVDHRADIYSLGVTFYEMLTGELPLGRFPPPSKTPGVDERLDAVVLRTLERDPAQRFQQASEVKTQIESIGVGKLSAGASVQPPANPPAEPGWGGWWRQQTLGTRQTIKLILWLLMIASAYVFGNFHYSSGQTEELVIGLIQPWYESESGPHGGSRVWNLWTVSGLAGHLALICLAWLVVIGLWEKQKRRPLTPEETRGKIRLAGGWLIATGIVTLLACVPILVLAIVLDGLGHGRIWEGAITSLVIQTLYALPAGVIMIFGGVSMLRFQRHGWGITGSILAMIPLSLGVVLGLPVGIWCLTLLCCREVRDEFQRAMWLAKNRDFQSSQRS